MPTSPEAGSHWHTDENGRRFRNIPINLVERRALLDHRRLNLRRHRQLLALEAEFEILWKHGVIYEDGLPRD
jgi:hypothetical protein